MKHILKPLVVFFSLSLVFRFWFINTHANLGPDLSYAFKPIYEGFPYPFTWLNTILGDGMGAYVVNTLWTYPAQALYQLFIKFNIPFWFQMKYLAVLPGVLISVFGLYKLAKIYSFDWASASLIFLINSYTLIILDGGQLNLFLAFSLLPICFFLFKSITKLKVSNSLPFILLVWVMSLFDIRVILLLGVIIAIDIGVELLFIQGWPEKLRLIRRYFLLGVLGGAILVLLNMYWILPGFLAKSIALPVGHERVSQVNLFSFSGISHALFLQQPHWYQNKFGVVNTPQFYFAFVPLFVFGALFIGKVTRKEVVLTVVALIGIFLVKGGQGPFGGVYPWLFKNLPGFSVFRDPSKFYMLIVFAYALLGGITVKKITEKIGKNIVYIFIAIFLILIAYPAYTKKMTGTFSPVPMEKEYFDLAKWMSSQPVFFRTFWIPTKSALGYSSYTHPSVEAVGFVQKRPFATAVVGNYEQYNFLREGNYTGELFDIAGIKYILYPYPDTRLGGLKEDDAKYYYTFLDQLASLNWTNLISNFGSDIQPIPVLQTRQNQDHFFAISNTYLVLGADDIYKDLSKLGVKFAENAMVFMEERPKVLEDKERIPFNKIILNGKTDNDLAAANLPGSEFIFPASTLDFEPNATGWWKRETVDLVWWRSFLQEKYGLDNLDFDYGGGWAVAEGERQLSITNSQFVKGDALLARVMQSSRGGTVEFWQGDKKIGEMDTSLEKPETVEIKLTGNDEVPDQVFTYDKAKFDWIQIGELVQDNDLVIRTRGDINVVNSIASIEPAVWKSDLERAGELIKEKGIDWQKLSPSQSANLFEVSEKPKVSYDRLSPTHYKVRIAGLKAPATLAFSETYDPLWTADKTGSYPLFSLINGFKITQDGEYDIYFEPQKYVLPGLIISAATLISCIMFLWLKSRNSS